MIPILFWIRQTSHYDCCENKMCYIAKYKSKLAHFYSWERLFVINPNVVLWETSDHAVFFLSFLFSCCDLLLRSEVVTDVPNKVASKFICNFKVFINCQEIFLKYWVENLLSRYNESDNIVILSID